jgi:hypothetical protein
MISCRGIGRKRLSNNKHVQRCNAYFALRAKPLPLASQVDAADGPLSWRLGDVGSAVPRRVVLLLGALIEAGPLDAGRRCAGLQPRPRLVHRSST